MTLLYPKEILLPGNTVAIMVVIGIYTFGKSVMREGGRGTKNLERGYRTNNENAMHHSLFLVFYKLIWGQNCLHNLILCRFIHVHNWSGVGVH